jgi:hypothetical protein
LFFGDGLIFIDRSAWRSYPFDERGSWVFLLKTASRKLRNLEGADHLFFTVCEIISYDICAILIFIPHNLTVEKPSGCVFAYSPCDFPINSHVGQGLLATISQRFTIFQPAEAGCSKESPEGPYQFHVGKMTNTSRLLLSGPDAEWTRRDF